MTSFNTDLKKKNLETKQGNEDLIFSMYENTINNKENDFHAIS